MHCNIGSNPRGRHTGLTEPQHFSDPGSANAVTQHPSGRMYGVPSGRRTSRTSKRGALSRDTTSFPSGRSTSRTSKRGHTTSSLPMYCTCPNQCTAFPPSDRSTSQTSARRDTTSSHLMDVHQTSGRSATTPSPLTQMRLATMELKQNKNLKEIRSKLLIGRLMPIG